MLAKAQHAQTHDKQYQDRAHRNGQCEAAVSAMNAQTMRF
jgi:hypothetical protein